MKKRKQKKLDNSWIKNLNDYLEFDKICIFISFLNYIYPKFDIFSSLLFWFEFLGQASFGQV